MHIIIIRISIFSLEFISLGNLGASRNSNNAHNVYTFLTHSHTCMKRTSNVRACATACFLLSLSVVVVFVVIVLLSFLSQRRRMLLSFVVSPRCLFFLHFYKELYWCRKTNRLIYLEIIQQLS